MKSITGLLSIALAGIVIMSFTEKPATSGKYEIDVNESSITWHAEKVTGQHHGTVNIKSGSFSANDDGTLTGGQIVIDMQSLKNKDMEGEMAKKLEGHLKSEDFFNVAEHPTATLNIKNVYPRGLENEYKVVGDLTIKNITKEIKFNAVFKPFEGGAKAYAEFNIDRTDYNVKYGSSTFFGALGDNTIYDDFMLKGELRCSTK